MPQWAQRYCKTLSIVPSSFWVPGSSRIFAPSLNSVLKETDVLISGFPKLIWNFHYVSHTSVRGLGDRQQSTVSKVHRCVSVAFLLLLFIFFPSSSQVIKEEEKLALTTMHSFKSVVCTWNPSYWHSKYLFSQIMIVVMSFKKPILKFITSFFSLHFYSTRPPLNQ